MKTASPSFALAIIIFCAVAHWTFGAESQINQRLKATFDQAKAHGITKGMTAAQVESIIGKPDNADWNVGFKFGENNIRVWLCVEKKRADLASWRDYVLDDRRFGLGYFLLVVNDQLESPVPSLTSKDAVVLHNLATNGKAATFNKDPVSKTPAKL